MVRDAYADEPEPDPAEVFDALQDEDCRAIVRALSEPMTAVEISEATGIPKSTTYRKLELLTDAGLLAEGVEIRPDGQHASRYGVVFDEITVGLSTNREFQVDVDIDIDRGPQTAEERLASLWSEVRKET